MCFVCSISNLLNLSLLGEIILLGGRHPSGQELDSVIAYNIATKEVRHLANLPCAKKGAAACIWHYEVGPILVIMGGINQGSILNDLHLYVPVMDT